MRHVVIACVLLWFGAACNTGEDSEDSRQQLKQQLKEELRAELRAEMLSEMSRLRGNREQPPMEQLQPVEPARVPVAPERVVDEPERLPPPIAPRENRGQAVQPAEIVEVVDPDEPVRADPAIDEPATDLEPPVADPAEPPAEAQPEGDPTPSVSGLELIQLVVAERINRTERIPEAPSSSFDASLGKVFAFAVIKNPNERTQVQFQWRREGKVVHSLPLKVGKSDRGWRTWASARISRRTAGRWEVRILDDTGAQLGSRAFDVR